MPLVRWEPHPLGSRAAVSNGLGLFSLQTQARGDHLNGQHILSLRAQPRLSAVCVCRAQGRQKRHSPESLHKRLRGKLSLPASSLEEVPLSSQMHSWPARDTLGSGPGKSVLNLHLWGKTW